MTLKYVHEKSQKDILEDKLGFSNQVTRVLGLQFGSIQDLIFYLNFLTYEIRGLGQCNGFQSFVLLCHSNNRRLFINEFILLCAMFGLLLQTHTSVAVE